MLNPIRVKPKSSKDGLDTISRVNYGKPHSIDVRRALKVYDLGDVHQSSMKDFRMSFKDVCSKIVAQRSIYQNGQVEPQRDKYQDGLDDDENSGADDQDRGGHSAENDSNDELGSETE